MKNTSYCTLFFILLFACKNQDLNISTPTASSGIIQSVWLERELNEGDLKATIDFTNLNANLSSQNITEAGVFWGSKNETLSDKSAKFTVPLKELEMYKLDNVLSKAIDLGKISGIKMRPYFKKDGKYYLEGQVNEITDDKPSCYIKAKALSYTQLYNIDFDKLKGYGICFAKNKIHGFSRKGAIIKVEPQTNNIISYTGTFTAQQKPIELTALNILQFNNDILVYDNSPTGIGYLYRFNEAIENWVTVSENFPKSVSYSLISKDNEYFYFKDKADQYIYKWSIASEKLEIVDDYKNLPKTVINKVWNGKLYIYEEQNEIKMYEIGSKTAAIVLAKLDNICGENLVINSIVSVGNKVFINTFNKSNYNDTPIISIDLKSKNKLNYYTTKNLSLSEWKVLGNGALYRFKDVNGKENIEVLQLNE